MLNFISELISPSASLGSIGYAPKLASIKTYRKCLISCILVIYIYYQLIFIPFEFFVNQNTKRLRKSSKFISTSFGYGLIFLVLACAMRPTLVDVLLGFGMLLCMILMTIGFLLKTRIIIIIFHTIGQVCGLYIGFDVISGGWIQM